MQVLYCPLLWHRHPPKDGCGVYAPHPAGRQLVRTVRTFSTMTTGSVGPRRLARGAAASPISSWRAPVSSGVRFITCSRMTAQPAAGEPTPSQDSTGRKTDVKDSKDSEWLADLLRHGLLTASFIPASTFASCGT